MCGLLEFFLRDREDADTSHCVSWLEIAAYARIKGIPFAIATASETGGSWRDPVRAVLRGVSRNGHR